MPYLPQLQFELNPKKNPQLSRYFVNPVFCSIHAHSVAKLVFYLCGEDLIFFKKDLESPLIFVLFFKGKQSKKENPKCDSLFGKDSL